MALYDLNDLQSKIHILAELNPDVPEAGDDDYEVRKILINKWIHSWENEEGMLWNELYTYTNITSTGALTYNLSSAYPDLKLPGGFVCLLDSTGENVLTYYPVKKPGEFQLEINSAEAFAYFTGNEHSGYTLTFNPKHYPTTAGEIIFHPYYKKATELSATSDKPEMSNPLYIVHGVVSDIYSTEDPQESDKHLQISQKILADMKLRNLMTPPYQGSAIPTRAGLLGNYGFGK